jgi:2-polyprenyl-6-methoxyphenol hydroxylase-like FAD-dependent oxidoreductase
MEMTGRIVVIGAGMAGLACALALSEPGREIVVLDRDPAPGGNVETAFRDWERKGVTQLRHSHVFLGRLYCLIRDFYPELLAELKASGAREWTFADGVPKTLKDQFAPQAGDDDMTILFSRRTTFEFKIRKFAERRPGVTFRTGAPVKGIVAERRDGRLVVTGVALATTDGEEVLSADIVVDASGRNSQIPEQLAALGAILPYEEHPAGILYFTRHYRFRDGASEPERGEVPGAGDLGYLKYGIFNADNRHFSLTLAVPEIETALRMAIPRPETFDAICARLPGVQKWTDNRTAEPVSKVFGMGNLKNAWRSYIAKDGTPAALNFFAVGDSLVRSNPLYGRGCSQAFIAAHILAEALEMHNDPAERAQAYDRTVRSELKPFWDAMVRQDKASIRRAENEQDPNYKPSAKARWIKSFVDDAINPATRGDMKVLRAVMRPFQMLEAPSVWLRNPFVVGRVLWMWMKPKSAKAQFYTPKLGPERTEMLQALNLAPIQAVA